MRIRLLPLMILCSLLFCAQVNALTVSGHISDANGADVVGIKVKVMDSDLGPDDIIDTVYTDANGNYSTGKAENGHDVYIVVVYEMKLTGPLANGKSGYLAYDGETSPYTFDTDDLPDGYFPDITGNITIDVPTGGSGSGGADAPGEEIQAIKYIQHDLDFFVHEGISGWVVPCDLGINVLKSKPKLWWQADGGNGQCEVGINVLLPINNAAQQYIYDEFGHVFQYKAWGAWPSSQYLGRGHNLTSQYDEGFAICEGWADYVHDSVGRWKGLQGFPVNPDYWRGDNSAHNRPGATASGTDFSGEIVEGAILNIFRELDFVEVFNVIMEDEAETAKEFSTRYLARYSPMKYRKLLGHYAENGIVYARAAITGFAEGAPSTSSPPSTGNAKIIDDVMFLRNEVTVEKKQVSADTLNLSSSVNSLGWVMLCYKVAQDTWQNNVFYQGPWQRAGTAVWSSSYTWDTDSISDGAYDLIMQAADENAFVDKFYPDFQGDPGPNKAGTINGTPYNEKWLKYQGTWYSREPHPGADPPSTSDKKKGKVIIDNTPPTISNTSPK